MGNEQLLCKVSGCIWCVTFVSGVCMYATQHPAMQLQHGNGVGVHASLCCAAMR
jgi:hypothetical protein